MSLDATAQATVRFVVWAYVGHILLQRFAVPGVPIAALLPLVYVVAAWGMFRGLVEVHPQRMAMWFLTVALTAAVVLVQAMVLDRELVSVSSWALFMAVWAPFGLRLTDRRTRTYLVVLDRVTKVSTVLAYGCLLMMASQFAGLAYRDWLAELVPAPLLLNGFVITYPVEYGSAIFRANAWIGLEPSTVSAQLGIGLVAAVLTGARTRTILVLLAGLITTTSGSGFAIMGVALLVVLATSARLRLRRYLPAALVAVVVGAVSPMGETIWRRLTSPGLDPSLSLRAIDPYLYLWPDWVANVSMPLLGGGPGSSQELILRSGIDGLLVATPIKLFFDYGLIGGAVIAAFMLLACLDAPSRALALTIAFSMWTLQPGTTAPVVVVPLLLLVSWWAPRHSDALEKRFVVTRRARGPYTANYGDQLGQPGAVGGI